VLVLLLALVSVSSAAAAVSGPAATNLSAAQITVRPSTARLGQRPRIVVSNIVARSLQVQLVGATGQSGKLIGWRSLRFVDRTWVATLPAPALHGIYPIELRTAAGATTFGSPRWLLRVFEPGTASRPSFSDPADVVDWWVRTVPGRTIVAFKAWPLPDFDRRDVRLHRLFVVAYSPTGDVDPLDRLGIFITAVREGYQGRWRLLEATVEP